MARKKGNIIRGYRPKRSNICKWGKYKRGSKKGRCKPNPKK